jgi:hypothetical protein
MDFNLSLKEQQTLNSSPQGVLRLLTSNKSSILRIKHRTFKSDILNGKKLFLRRFIIKRKCVSLKLL